MKVKPPKLDNKCPRQPPITHYYNCPPIKSLTDNPKGPPIGQVPPLDPGEKPLIDSHLNQEDIREKCDQA